MEGNNVKNKAIRAYLDAKATAPTLSKGKRMFEAGACRLRRLDRTAELAVFEVENDYYYGKTHRVTITNFNHPAFIYTESDQLNVRGGIDRYTVAALLALEAKLGYEQPPAEMYDQAHTEIEMDGISKSVLERSMSAEDWQRAKRLAGENRAHIKTGNEHNLTATVKFKHQAHAVGIRRTQKGHFQSSCDCKQSQHPVCLHKGAVFLQLLAQKGRHAFDYMRDLDAEKNSLLAEYGFTTADNLKGKFDFSFSGGKLHLHLLDPSITKLADFNKIAGRFVAGRLGQPQEAKLGALHKLDRPPAAGKQAEQLVAYVFCIEKNGNMPGFELVPATGKLSTTGGQLSKFKPLLDFKGGLAPDGFAALAPDDLQILQLCERLKATSIGRFARFETKLECESTWSLKGECTLSEIAWAGGSVNDSSAVFGRIGADLLQLFALLQNKFVYLSGDAPESISTFRQLRRVQPDPLPFEMSFELTENGGLAELKASMKNGEVTLPPSVHEEVSPNMLMHGDTLMLLKTYSDYQSFQAFKMRPGIRVSTAWLPRLLQQLVVPLKSKHEVKLGIEMAEYLPDPADIKPQLFLKEEDGHVIFQPLVSYGRGVLAELDGQGEQICELDGGFATLRRNLRAEREWGGFLRSLHPDFEGQDELTGGLHYYLPFESLMENRWFFTFFDALKKRDVETFGLKELTRFPYNINTPEVEMKVSSGIDWFDIGAEVRWGDQSASLRDVQRALVRNEKFVKLGDGSLGLLPEQWLEKHATLLKMGSVEDGKIRVSKVHFSLLEELYDQIDDGAIQLELREKRRKLQNFGEIAQVSLSPEMDRLLRPYQKSGVGWLGFLQEFGWGGCLADDMGLGKTLQVLAFLQHQKSLGKKGKTNLVVAPTSLLFNWEGEIDKFCPDLSYYRHHGPFRERERLPKIFKNYDIIITSYGILASDIAEFSQMVFHYAVLDESQAIKNPSTKRYKAVRLLQAQNRVALTGTPIENNTLDLYAQMNFLNPGMLGGMEFFNQEFASPIDRKSDENKAEALRKIVYPFILRRTKEVVASDLPEKTETVLYCEMGARQRKVYNTFRDVYRMKILEKIEEEGVRRAGMFILEGLMKLRQICDSPALLNNPEDYGTDSVKLDELMEHITEKTGKHKILVFSQFLKMLDMVGEQLHKRKVGFVRLDGSVSAAMRKEAVNRFQNEEGVRVFLISLKAGSQGLNLTAADYVFLVDPWWNPALERQAVDRTHRIGQTNRVFAYKMICKDSVEEKILHLQQKKQMLAADIIGNEGGFVKKLSRGDVEFLFG